MERTSFQGKTTAVVAYITILGTLIAYFMNLDPKNKFAAFHIRQALGIHVTYFLIGALLNIVENLLIQLSDDMFFITTFPLYIFVIVLWGYGIVSAFQGSVKPVPLLGELYQKLFTKREK